MDRRQPRRQQLDDSNSKASASKTRTHQNSAATTHLSSTRKGGMGALDPDHPSPDSINRAMLSSLEEATGPPASAAVVSTSPVRGSNKAAQNQDRREKMGSSSETINIGVQNVVGSFDAHENNGGGRSNDESGDQLLVSWLNRVLYPNGVDVAGNRPLRSLADLGNCRLLFHAVRRVVGQGNSLMSSPTAKEDDDGPLYSFGGEDTDDERAGAGDASRLPSTRGSWRSSRTSVSAANDGPYGQSQRSESDFGLRPIRGGSSWEVCMGVIDQTGSKTAEGDNEKTKAKWSRSLSPNEDNEGSGEGGGGEGNGGRRSSMGAISMGRSSSKFRSLLGLSSGRKKDRQKERRSTARKMKRDIYFLLNGQVLGAKDAFRLPPNIDKAVDRACAGDLDAVRNLLSILRDYQTILPAARAAETRSISRRRSASCEPGPKMSRTRASNEATMAGIKKSSSSDGQDTPAPTTTTVQAVDDSSNTSTRPAAPARAVPVTSSSVAVDERRRRRHSIDSSPLVRRVALPQNTTASAVAGFKPRGSSRSAHLFGGSHNHALMAAGVLASSGDATVKQRGTLSPNTLSDAELQDAESTPARREDAPDSTDISKAKIAAGKEAKDRSAEGKVRRSDRDESSSSTLPPRTTSRSSTRSPSPADRSSAGSPQSQAQPQQQQNYRSNSHGRIVDGRAGPLPMAASFVPSPSTLPPKSTNVSRATPKTSSSSIDVVLAPSPPPIDGSPVTMATAQSLLLPPGQQEQLAGRSSRQPCPKMESSPVATNGGDSSNNRAASAHEQSECGKLWAWRSRSTTPTTQPGPSPTERAAAEARRAAGDADASAVAPILDSTRSTSSPALQSALAAATAATAPGSTPGSACKPVSLGQRPPIPPMPTRPMLSSSSATVVAPTPSYAVLHVQPEARRTIMDTALSGAVKPLSGAARLAADDRAVPATDALFPDTEATRDSSVASHRSSLSGEVVRMTGHKAGGTACLVVPDSLYEDRAVLPGSTLNMVGDGESSCQTLGERQTPAGNDAVVSTSDGRYPSSYFGSSGGGLSSRTQARLPVVAEAQATAPAGGHEAKLSAAFKRVVARKERSSGGVIRGPTADAGNKSRERRHGSGSKEERKRRSGHDRRGKSSRDGREARGDEHRRREGSRRDQRDSQRLHAVPSEHTRDIATVILGNEPAVMNKAAILRSTATEESVPRRTSSVDIFGSTCSEGVRLVIEFVGNVEMVASAKVLCSSWRQAVQGREGRLFKLIVRRAGVTPKRRAAFWEHMILRSTPLHHGRASGLQDPLLARQGSGQTRAAAAAAGKRASLSELSRQGGSSVWSKAIDADVARTFGRPTSFRRGDYGLDARQDSRRRHWWPESLGGAPLGAMTPVRQNLQNEKKQPQEEDNATIHRSTPADADGWEMVEHALDSKGSPRASSRAGNGKYRRQFSRSRAPIDPTAAARATPAESGESRGHHRNVSDATSLGSPGMFSALVTLPPPEPPAAKVIHGNKQGNFSTRAHSSGVALPSGGEDVAGGDGADTARRGEQGGSRPIGRAEDNRLMMPNSKEVSCIESSPTFLSTGAVSTEGFSTLSPLGSEASAGSFAGSEMDGGGLASPSTLRQLESVKAQLTDLLRALAVSFGQVGYCQGLDYVAAHLIKCLGTDSDRGFASDPERVFTVLLGLFRGYDLQHLYSENLEALQLMLRVLDLLIEEHLPILHRHFQEQEVDVNYFAVGWFQTLFLYTSRMPSDTLLWLWDVWVTERSFKVFFRAAIAILRLSEPWLLQLDLESIMLYLSRFPHDGVLEKKNLAPAALCTKARLKRLPEFSEARKVLLNAVHGEVVSVLGGLARSSDHKGCRAHVTNSLLREAQRKLDDAKNPGDQGLGWTRPPQPQIANQDQTQTQSEAAESRESPPFAGGSTAGGSPTVTTDDPFASSTRDVHQRNPENTRQPSNIGGDGRQQAGFLTPSKTRHGQNSGGGSRGTSAFASRSSSSIGSNGGGGGAGSQRVRRGSGGSPLIFGEHSTDSAAGGGRTADRYGDDLRRSNNPIASDSYNDVVPDDQLPTQSPVLGVVASGRDLPLAAAPVQQHNGTESVSSVVRRTDSDDVASAGDDAGVVNVASITQAANMASDSSAGGLTSRTSPLPLPMPSTYVPPDEDGGEPGFGLGQEGHHHRAQLQSRALPIPTPPETDYADDMPVEMDRLESRSTATTAFGSNGSSQGRFNSGSGGGGGSAAAGQIGSDFGSGSGGTSKSKKLGGKAEYALVAVGDE